MTILCCISIEFTAKTDFCITFCILFWIIFVIMKQFGFDRTVAQNYHNYQSLPVLIYIKTKIKTEKTIQIYFYWHFKNFFVDSTQCSFFVFSKYTIVCRGQVKICGTDQCVIVVRVPRAVEADADRLVVVVVNHIVVRRHTWAVVVVRASDGVARVVASSEIRRQSQCRKPAQTCTHSLSSILTLSR